MTHHYQDPDGWLAFAQWLGIEEEYMALCQEREKELQTQASE